MSLLKFSPNEKIFAKVRGYPPWPARVVGVAHETPSKIKYHVYFYGTGQTAVCKQEELFPYLDNREKFGKPTKKKGFNKGLRQVDSELGLSPSKHLGPIPNEQDNEADGSLVIDVTPGKQAKSGTTRATPTSTKVNELRSKKRHSTDKETHPAKKHRKKSHASSDVDSPAVSQKSTPSEPPISRSVRNIKPKKFSNEGEGESDQDQETPKGRQGSRPYRSSTGSLGRPKSKVSRKRRDMELYAELFNDSMLVAFTPKGVIKLKLNLNKPRPTSFKSERVSIEWEEKVLGNGKTLKVQIESGEILPQNVKKEILSSPEYQDMLVKQEHKMSSNDKLEYLKIEAHLLNIDSQIKNSLSLKRPDPTSCLKHLDKMLNVQLHPLMIKKHPEVLDTVKKLRKYVGNTSKFSWNMNEEETLIFAGKAASIRSKAEQIFNKIRSLFVVPYGESFLEVFAKELKTFNATVKSMNIDDVISLTSDPTDKDIVESEEDEQNSTLEISAV